MKAHSEDSTHRGNTPEEILARAVPTRTRFRAVYPDQTLSQLVLQSTESSHLILQL